MNEKNQIILTFGSYLKFFTAITFLWSLCFALMLLIIAAAGGGVTFNFGNSSFYGMKAAGMWAWFAPLVFLVLSPVFGLLCYFPSKAFLAIAGGLKARL